LRPAVVVKVTDWGLEKQDLDLRIKGLLDFGDWLQWRKRLAYTKSLLNNLQFMTQTFVIGEFKAGAADEHLGLDVYRYLVLVIGDPRGY
jgi:hypothetical protein